MLAAVATLRSAGVAIHDVFAPYPVHGLDQAMGIRRSRLPFVTLLAGLGGLCFALAFQYYTAVFDWPLDVGGKPENSTLAFVPVCFELTVLIGGLGTVGAFLLRARLFPGQGRGASGPGRDEQRVCGRHARAARRKRGRARPPDHDRERRRRGRRTGRATEGDDS